MADLKNRYMTFLDDELQDGIYKEKIRAMKTKNDNRLIINVNDLRARFHEETKALMARPMEHIPVLEEVLKEIMSSIDPDYVKRIEATYDLHVGFEGSFGAHAVNPRTLSARFLGSLVSLEGIVTRCSLVRPKVRKSVHYCEATEKTVVRDFKDATSIGPFSVSSNFYPTKDEEGNLLVTEYGLSTYRDFQTISIQEMPEKAPAGQLPRSVDIILDEDLVDKAKPGDRVQIIGTYRSIPNKNGGTTSGIFRTVLIAHSVRLLSKDIIHPTITDVDIQQVKKISKRKDVTALLARSLAPSIYGHSQIKKALLLLLLGGTEKNLVNGTHIRGDINMMMVGDPSTAKSQLLRFVLNIAPLAIATTGRGSSGVGLTAAVVHDKETGERRLEAGAMVLADRGVVCIDEFDKMNDADRVAIHEVMEQQTVTIAKAGIHTSLNARCSVVAAANPVYGQYNKQKRPTENIGLPDSLLSRFDLLFIVLDHLNPVHDREISTHVLRMHQYRRPGEEDGAPTIDVDFEEEEDDGEEDAPVYEKTDKFMAGGKDKQKKGPKNDSLSLSFLKKYLHYAKQRIKPKLTKEAADYIASSYAELRSNADTSQDRTLPITARTLETLIRLSTAHAKARLSKDIEVEDAKAARELVQFALNNETDIEKVKKAKKTQEEPTQAAKPAQQAATQTQSDDEDAVPLVRKRKRADDDEGQDTVATLRDVSDTQATLVDQQSSMDVDQPSGSGNRPIMVTRSRDQTFRSLLAKVSMEAKGTSALDFQETLEEINRRIPDHPFSVAEAEHILATMQNENKVFYQDGQIFLM